MPPEAVSQFHSLAMKVIAQGKRWRNLEHFKGFFAAAVGSPHYPSSSESWAETDLRSYMDSAASNPPMFLEAFFEACNGLNKSGGVEIPDVELINKLCRQYQIGFEIHPPNIIELQVAPPPIAVPEAPPTLNESAAELLQQSMIRAEQLLSEQRPREAVQEMLWVLESLTTGFKGVALGDSQVKGKYFNQIADELKRALKGSTFERVLSWCEQLHGYLSSPTGGAVRHGIDLSIPNSISTNEARLFCNLIRSYVGYLQAEHERLNSTPAF